MFLVLRIENRDFTIYILPTSGTYVLFSFVYCLAFLDIKEWDHGDMETRKTEFLEHLASKE